MRSLMLRLTRSRMSVLGETLTGRSISYERSDDAAAGVLKTEETKIEEQGQRDELSKHQGLQCFWSEAIEKGTERKQAEWLDEEELELEMEFKIYDKAHVGAKTAERSRKEDPVKATESEKTRNSS